MSTQDIASATAACVGIPSSNSVYLTKDGKISAIGERLKKAADFAGVDEKDLADSLVKIGVDDTPQGLQLLDSDMASADVLEQSLSVLATIPVLKRKAAVAILKGADPFKKDPPEQKPAIPVLQEGSLSEIVKALRDIYKMKDRELIELYDKERDMEVEQELNRRAKNQPFIILKGIQYEPGKEMIDIEQSVEQLKRARKGYTVPAWVPGIDSRIVRVYRITELNPEDRIVELCPICGEILYKGYCSKCELNFSGVDDDSRAYVKLVAACEKFNAKSHSDRKALHASSTKGLGDLRTTWPSIAPTFEELKLTNNLPRLRMIKNIPATQVADPFHVSGNRSY
jgi:hypothetical protein